MATKKKRTPYMLTEPNWAEFSLHKQMNKSNRLGNSLNTLFMLKLMAKKLTSLFVIGLRKAPSGLKKNRK